MKRKGATLDRCPYCKVVWLRKWRRSFAAHVPRCFKRPRDSASSRVNCALPTEPLTARASSERVGNGTDREPRGGEYQTVDEGFASKTGAFSRYGDTGNAVNDDNAVNEDNAISDDSGNDDDVNDGNVNDGNVNDGNVNDGDVNGSIVYGGNANNSNLEDGNVNDSNIKDGSISGANVNDGDANGGHAVVDSETDSDTMRLHSDDESDSDEENQECFRSESTWNSLRLGRCSERAERGLRLANCFMEEGLQGVLNFLHTEAPSLNITRSATTILRHQARLVDEKDIQEVQLVVPQELRSVLGMNISFPMLRHPWREISTVVSGHEEACVYDFQISELRSEFWHGNAWRRAQNSAGGARAHIAPVTIWHDGTLVTRKTSATCVVVEPAFLPQALLRSGRFLVPVAVMPVWEAATPKNLKVSFKRWEAMVKGAEQWVQRKVLHTVVDRITSASSEEVTNLLRSSCRVVPSFLAALGDSKELHNLLGLYAAGSASRCPCRMCYVTRNETNCFDPESWMATHGGSWIAQEAYGRQKRECPAREDSEASEHTLFATGPTTLHFLHPREAPYDLLHTLGEWPKLAVTLTYELVGKLGGRRLCIELDAIVKSLAPKKPAPASWVRWTSNYQIRHLIGTDGRSTKAFVYTREWPSIALLVAFAFLAKPKLLSDGNSSSACSRAVVLDALTGTAGSIFDCHRREWTSRCIDQVTASLSFSAKSLANLWALVQEASGKSSSGAPLTAIKLHAPPAHFWSQLQDYATLNGTDTERHEAWNKRAKVAWRRMAKVHAGGPRSSTALLRKLLIFRRLGYASPSHSVESKSVKGGVSGALLGLSSTSSSRGIPSNPAYIPPGGKIYELQVSDEDLQIMGHSSAKEKLGERVNWSALLQTTGISTEKSGRFRCVSRLVVSCKENHQDQSFTVQSSMLGGQRSFVNVRVEAENEHPKDMTMEMLAIMCYQGRFFFLGVYLKDVGLQERKRRLEGAPTQWSLLKYEIIKGQVQAECIPVSSTTISPACIVRLEVDEAPGARRYLKIPRGYFRREPGDAFEWTDRMPLSQENMYEQRRSLCSSSADRNKLWNVEVTRTNRGLTSTGWLRPDASDLTKVATAAASDGLEKLVGYTFPFKVSPLSTWRATIVGLKSRVRSGGDAIYIAELQDGTRIEVNQNQLPQDATPPRFQSWWLRQVAKSFVVPGAQDRESSVFVGRVQPEVRFERSWNGAFLEPLFKIVYSDGDFEEMEAAEVERRLLPLCNDLKSG